MRSAVRLGSVAVLSSLLALAGACGGGSGDGDDGNGIPPLPDAGPNSFVVSGSVFGADARPGDFNGLFTNEDNVGSLHVYGLGRSTDGMRFSMALPSSVPMEAQNGGTVAVGHIVMTEIDDSIPEGRPSSADGAKIIGVSTEHMVVYRAAPFVENYAWEDSFPAGWSCGICQRSLNGLPDTLNPTSCETIIIDMGSFGALDACNPFTTTE